jgi:hypothetical protein
MRTPGAAATTILTQIATAGAAALVACILVAPSVAQPTGPQAGSQAGRQANARRIVRQAQAEPVVVELFTAQGCPGCPEANRAIEAVSTEPGVLALTYAVDYWDYLGWPDTFARPEFAQRQNAYRAALRIRNVYTPQVVIDGARQMPGAASPALQQAVTAALADRTPPPQIEFRESGDRVGVGSGRVPRGGAEVWAVVYTPGAQTVAVSGGDNRGQTVRHVNVVRRLTKLGAWNGRPALYPLPRRPGAGEAVAVLVQGREDRRILSAATL